MDGHLTQNFHGARRINMLYEPLKTMNPSQEDVTIKSSKWLAVRGIMPGKGKAGVSFPDFMNGVKTCPVSDLTTAALLSISSSNVVTNIESSAGSMIWNGCWMYNNVSVICRGGAAGGITPINKFNVGQQYKKGWRPSIVS
jgi:hypothetical protein